MFAGLLDCGHETGGGTCESHVKVNCVEAGLDFLDASCRILTFSCPCDGVIGYFSAVNIDADIIPVLSSLNN